MSETWDMAVDLATSATATLYFYSKDPKHFYSKDPKKLKGIVECGLTDMEITIGMLRLKIKLGIKLCISTIRTWTCILMNCWSLR